MEDGGVLRKEAVEAERHQGKIIFPGCRHSSISSLGPVARTQYV